jgi:hypothetical protein
MTVLISCSHSKKTEIKLISDYCQIYGKLDNKMEVEVLSYWDKTTKTISAKNADGGKKTPEEKFVEIMTNYAGKNEKKYLEKKCDKQ